jgi:hypothetical protein
MRGISWIAESQLASQEGLCSMEWVSNLSYDIHCWNNVKHEVGWGTELQAGTSRVRFPTVSLELFIDVNLPAALLPWDRLSLEQKWVPRIFHGGVNVVKSGSLKLLEPSRPVQTSTGIALRLPFTVEMSLGYFYSKSRELIWAAHRTSALINGNLFVSSPVNRNFTCMLYFEI